ncbi:MAG: type II secretion system protein GspE [Cyanobacteria bacterium SIG30]|nr:type II secretion system protein GspE [Cyanobacteria bacterium SIG30]
MINENPLLTKLLNKVDFELVQRFKVERMKELFFIPVNVQSDSFFIVVCSKTNTRILPEKIGHLVNASNIEYIYLTPDRFDTLFKLFEARLLTSEYKKSNLNQNHGPVALKKVVKEGEAPDPLDLFSEEDIVDSEIEYSDVSDEENPLTLDDIMNDDEEENIINLDEEIKEEPVYQEQNDDEDEDVINIDAGESRINTVKAPQTKKIGEILVEEGIITQKQLTIALAESKAQDIPLGSILVKLGYVTIQDLKEALGAQQGMQLATTEQLKALPSVIPILPEDFVKINKVVPLSATKKTLVVGMVNPGDTKTINEIIYQTGLKPTVMMITHYEYENFIKTYYETGQKQASKIMEEVQQAQDTEEVDKNEDNLWEQVEKEIQDATGSVSKFAYNIITLGIDQKASDIHIEPRLEGYIVRYRIDGILREIFKIPQKIESQVISRFKVLARMNIAEHRRCQDGNFTISYKNLKYDFRINTLPVAGKEKMVIRILAPAVTVAQRKTEITLEGAQKDDIEKIKNMISTPNGIILTSGPTGSGKTTTLYSLISYLNSEQVNITTIEDPVEIKLDGVNQSAVNPKAGVTFATSLRAILRQDPDIILVGEIRDYETLEVAISASLTGHLVLSTIHTNSAAATITRLIEMGAKDYLISSTLSGVLAQRLVRKLCPNCRVAYKPTIEDAKKVLKDPLEIAEFTKQTIYKPGGCTMCNDTGYAGRVGIYEVLPINKEVKKLIAQRAHDVVIEEYAVSNGMKTLKAACIEHIKNGVTTIDEYVRTLGLASD